MRPFEQLLDSMNYLVRGNRMLAGLGVCYGTARDSRHALCGNAQEVLLGPDGFAPAARPLTGRTLYDLASLTKLFTCLCVLRLREDGREDILAYGIAFNKKRCKAVCERLSGAVK